MALGCGDISLALLTDLYQFTMAYGYWRSGRHREIAEFELFFRDPPFEGGFSLYCGLQEVLLYLRDFRLSDEEIAYLESALPSTVDKAFYRYLKTVDASEVTVKSIAEGSVVFARVGFDCTSNVLAGKLYDIPVAGTVGHSYVTSFSSLEEVHPKVLEPAGGKDPAVDFLVLVEAWLQQVCQLLGVSPEHVNRGELAAFVSYGIAFPLNFLVLVDTYCVKRSGVPNFCAVALALHQLGYRAVGVRLDSGNLARQSVEIRSTFRACAKHFNVPAFEKLSIAISNNVSERSLLQLNQEDNEIDVIGVGTNLVTCPLQPSLGCVYKLVQVNGCPRMKLSEDQDKMTIPGSKTVYRLYDCHGHPFLDLMALEDEPPPSVGREMELHVLGRWEETRKVTPGATEVLHRVYFKDGQICQHLPTISDVKAHAQHSLNMLPSEHRKLHNPKPFKVALSEKLYHLLNNLRRTSHLQ
ncbi:nicotinate phosphoribosyltransferase isoform X3 [Pleurodeles waltl]|uniref:nicotinate phosphoribosyltransferase isoform X3 n=1 Tax=Pleurodeles waltl TaxID=8319 RepID=UPI003709C029